VRCLLTILFASAAFAQPSFDVASLKPSPPIEGDTYTADLGTVRPGGEVTIANGTLTDCVKFAYGLVSDDQVAGPDWVKSKLVRFDIIAKAPPSTPREQLLLMMRTLLAERFHLQIHTESRAFAHLVLTVGKDGPKLREPQPDLGPPRVRSMFGHIAHPRMAIGGLALLLSRQMRQLVLDETGLTGLYDIDLHWTPDTAPENADMGPTVFRAVQEQLGLKLEGRKDAVDVLVIDRADRIPVAN
jgi:uncharacterized protein (TIGR03435 family)